MSLASTSVQRPVSTMMFFVGVVFLGVVAFRYLSVDFLPPVKIPRLTVQTSSANTSPQEVEHAVTQPIETALGTVSGVKQVTSVSKEGVSSVAIEFYWGTDMDFAMIEVREKLDQARALLPRDAGRPTILTIDPTTEPVITLGLTSRSQVGTSAATDLVGLKETARVLVKRRLEQVEGVAQATVLGGVDREIRVKVDLPKLISLGLSLREVSDAISASNVTLPGGSIKSGLFRLPLRTVGEFTRPEEIRSVVVGTTTSGGQIRVADIASVLDTIKERQGLATYNGQEIIGLQIRKVGRANTVAVSRDVNTVIAQLKQEFPEIDICTLSDQAEFIGKSVDDVEQAIVIGAVLAFLVLFFFLRRPKYPLIIGLTMPVSILATLITMYFFKINLNVISLSGLALGIGMLGDNAIVVIENVTRLREKGMGLVEATLEGSKEISLAVTASTLTNVAIFLPIVFVQGVASQLFLDMGLTMTVSLMVSLLVAVTIVPMLVSREGTMQMRDRWPVRQLRSGFSHVTGALAPHFYATVDRFSALTVAKLDQYLAWGIRRRWTVLWGTVGLFLLSIIMSLFVTSEAAPDIDQSRFTVRLVMPRGTSLEGTSAAASRFETDLRRNPAVEGVYTSLGITDESNFWGSTDASLESAILEVRCRAGVSTAAVIDSVRRLAGRFQTEMSGVSFAVKPRGTTFQQILRPQANDIRVRVQGPEPNAARLIAQRFAESARTIPGLVDFRTSLQEGAPGFDLEVDRDAAARFGVNAQTVTQRLSDEIKGIEATSLSDFDKKITIRVIPAEGDRRSIERVLDSQLLVNGVAVPLRNLVKERESTSQGEIWRENQERAVVCLGNVSGRSLSSVVADLKSEAATLHPPSGYRITIGGENEEMEESFRSLIIIIGLSLFLVYMILAAEYESILYPLVILLTSPLAFVGAIGAMVMTGQHYNVMSLIGVVIMIGAVDNDAVIVVDIITALRREGVPLEDAIRMGMQQRLRPILMTTATTVFGIVPLVISFGTGSELVRALTIPITGGLIASTIFTVFTIPIVYCFIDQWAIGRK